MGRWIARVASRNQRGRVSSGLFGRCVAGRLLGRGTSAAATGVAVLAGDRYLISSCRRRRNAAWRFETIRQLLKLGKAAGSS
jgi:hypothetical protein